MPALPSPGKVFRVTHHYQLDEDLHAVSRLYFSYTGTPPAPFALDSLATTLYGDWIDNTGSLLAAVNKQLSLEIDDLSSSSGDVGLYATTNNGSRSGARTPASAAVLASYPVRRKYRGGHGRGYWPWGVAGDLQDDQTWTSAFVTACNTGLGNYLSAAIGHIGATYGTVSQVVVSWHQGNTVFTGPTGRARNISQVRSTPVVDPVSAFTIKTGVAQQRRRLLHLA